MLPCRRSGHMQAELEELKALWLDLRAQVDRLADERQHYLDFFEQASEAYVVTDVNGTILDVNGAAIDILQRRRLYLRGKPLASLVALERRRDFREHLRAIAAGEPMPPRAWSPTVERRERRSRVRVGEGRLEGGGGFVAHCRPLGALECPAPATRPTGCWPW